MVEITQEFGFDAAHFLGAGAPENRRIHGHSFYVDVTLRGEMDPATGMLQDFDEIRRVLAAIANDLDHRMLNDIPELGTPTLENLARYIFGHAQQSFPALVRVRVRRPSLGQSCMFEKT
jgi:6-pyruvoyltetrahydropterin/6-carboxytetrahydropterin synthase